MDIATYVETHVLEADPEADLTIAAARKVDGAERYLLDCSPAVPSETVENVQDDDRVRIGGIVDTTRFSGSGDVQITIEWSDDDARC